MKKITIKLDSISAGFALAAIAEDAERHNLEGKTAAAHQLYRVCAKICEAMENKSGAATWWTIADATAKRMSQRHAA